MAGPVRFRAIGRLEYRRIMNDGQEPKRGREPEFAAAYDQFAPEIWALAYARRLDADMARDVVQETFLRLWTAWERGETIHQPRAWLKRVARNLSEDLAKSAFRQHGTQTPEALRDLHGREPGPPEQLIRAETFSRIRALLAELPEADRQILTLRYALDYDPPKIAEAMGIAPSAVYMRLSRARQRLEQKLTEQGVLSLP